MILTEHPLHSRRQLRQAPLHAFAFLRAESMKRLGYEIIANPKADESAFDPLEHGRRMSPDLIKRIADPHYLFVKPPGPGHICHAGGFPKLHVQSRENVGAAGHTAVPARQDRFGQ